MKESIKDALVDFEVDKRIREKMEPWHRNAPRVKIVATRYVELSDSLLGI